MTDRVQDLMDALTKSVERAKEARLRGLHCIVCNRPTTGTCGDWCDECEGKPMCQLCAEEHWEDLHG